VLLLLALPEEYLNYYAQAAMPTCQLHYRCEVRPCSSVPGAEHAGENPGGLETSGTCGI